MSIRVALLRSAVTELLDAIDAGEPLSDAVAVGREALTRTAFELPALFPAQATTKHGIDVTLIGLFDGKLVGAWHDEEGADYAKVWNADGSYLDLANPDTMDLVAPEDAPLAAATGVAL